MKAEIRINQERMEARTETIRREFQTQLKEVEAGAECGRGTGTDAARRSDLSSIGLHHGPYSGASSKL
jgi:hypothetical protein